MTKNTILWKRRENAIARGVGSMHPRFFEKGLGSHFYDAEGREYIDFATGIAVCNTGHSHPDILTAVGAQLEKFSHCSFQVTPYESYIELAEKLNDIAPIEGPAKSIFLTSGSEAVENAVKIARAATGRRGVITFNGGYHGRTLLTLGMTGKILPYKAQFGPMPGDLFQGRYPIDYHNISIEDAMESLDAIFRTQIEPDQVAAIMLEPILGEGGFYRAPDAFLLKLRELCNRHGILLIFDEIQSGFARTGKMFASEHSGVKPDLMTAAKAMAGGFPISAVTGKADIMDAPRPGGLGGTYGGSPLGCAAGLAVLDIIKRENLCGRAQQIGKIIVERLSQIQAKGNSIGTIRGTGAMVAVEFVIDNDANMPNPDITKSLVQKCADNGLILLSCGIRGNVIRFLPALTISDETTHQAMDIIEKCILQSTT